MKEIFSSIFSKCFDSWCWWQLLYGAWKKLLKVSLALRLQAVIVQYIIRLRQEVRACKSSCASGLDLWVTARTHIQYWVFFSTVKRCRGEKKALLLAWKGSTGPKLESHIYGIRIGVKTMWVGKSLCWEKIWGLLVPVQKGRAEICFGIRRRTQKLV